MLTPKIVAGSLSCLDALNCARGLLTAARREWLTIAVPNLIAIWRLRESIGDFVRENEGLLATAQDLLFEIEEPWSGYPPSGNVLNHRHFPSAHHAVDWLLEHLQFQAARSATTRMFAEEAVEYLTVKEPRAVIRFEEVGERDSPFNTDHLPPPCEWPVAFSPDRVYPLSGLIVKSEKVPPTGFYFGFRWTEGLAAELRKTEGRANLWRLGAAMRLEIYSLLSKHTANAREAQLLLDTAKAQYGISPNVQFSGSLAGAATGPEENVPPNEMQTMILMVLAAAEPDRRMLTDVVAADIAKRFGDVYGEPDSTFKEALSQMVKARWIKNGGLGRGSTGYSIEDSGRKALARSTIRQFLENGPMQRLVG